MVTVHTLASLGRVAPRSTGPGVLPDGSVPPLYMRAEDPSSRAWHPPLRAEGP